MAPLNPCVKFASCLLLLAAVATVFFSPGVNADIQAQTINLPNGTIVTTFIDTTTQMPVNVTVTNPDGSYLVTADNGKHVEYKFANGTNVLIINNGTTTVSTLDWNNGTTATIYTSKNGMMAYAVLNIGNGTVVTAYPNGTEVVTQGNPPGGQTGTPSPSGSGGSSPSGNKASTRSSIASGTMALVVCSAVIALVFP